jgi:hypothetical protein
MRSLQRQAWKQRKRWMLGEGEGEGGVHCLPDEPRRATTYRALGASKRGRTWTWTWVSRTTDVGKEQRGNAWVAQTSMSVRAGKYVPAAEQASNTVAGNCMVSALTSATRANAISGLGNTTAWYFRPQRTLSGCGDEKTGADTQRTFWKDPCECAQSERIKKLKRVTRGPLASWKESKGERPHKERPRRRIRKQ